MPVSFDLNVMIDKELITKYLGGSLNPEESRKLLEWLKEDPQNEDWLFSLKSSHNMLDYDKNARMACTDEEWVRLKPFLKNRNKRRFPGLWMPAAAVVILIFFLGSLVGTRKPMPRHMSGNITISTRVGQQSQTVLPDGTTVFLNDCSSIGYDLSDWKRVRSVKLNGQASFDVVQIQSLPFNVVTDHFTISVKGTSFDVNCYSGEKQSSVSLKSGLVAVQFPDKDGEASLRPGESLIYDKLTNSYTIEGVSEKNAYSWENHVVAFDNNTLEEKRGELYRRYGYMIEVTEECAQDTYTALFDEDSIVEVLEVIAKITPSIRYQIDAANKTVKLYKENE